MPINQRVSAYRYNAPSESMYVAMGASFIGDYATFEPARIYINIGGCS